MSPVPHTGQNFSKMYTASPGSRSAIIGIPDGEICYMPCGHHHEFSREAMPPPLLPRSLFSDHRKRAMNEIDEGLTRIRRAPSER